MLNMIKSHLPEGFTLIRQHAPEILIDLKYTGNDNLVGRPLIGYSPSGSALLTEDAAKTLPKMISMLQTTALRRELNMHEPTLLLFDAYRPQMASDDFWEWSQTECVKNKQQYYPNIDKKDFFSLGYVAKQSSHSRGSTLDLTIVDTANGKMIPLDMGTAFDFMDELSHPDNANVSPQAFKHKQFLKKFMAEFGWIGISSEWWHFTFSNEPFPETYFNFPVVKYEQ